MNNTAIIQLAFFLISFSSLKEVNTFVTYLIQMIFYS